MPAECRREPWNRTPCRLMCGLRTYPEVASSRRSAWMEAIFILLLALGLNLAGNRGTGLWDRDEPRYAVSVREMREKGDWIFPSFNGEPRYHKPILIYWLMGLTTAVAGDNPFGARLVSGLAGAAHRGRRLVAGPTDVRSARWVAFRPDVRDRADRCGRVQAGDHRRDSDALAPGVPGEFVGPESAPLASGRRAVLDSPQPGHSDQGADRSRDDRRLDAPGLVVGMARPIAASSPLAMGSARTPAPDLPMVRGGQHRLARGVPAIRGREADCPPPRDRHGGSWRLSRATIPWFRRWSSTPGRPSCRPRSWVPGCAARRIRTSASCSGGSIGPLILLECFQTKLIHYYLPAFPACALLAAWLVLAISAEDVNIRRQPLGRFGMALLVGIGLAAGRGAPGRDSRSCPETSDGRWW